MTSAMSHAGEAAATAVQVAHRHFVIVLVNYHRVIWTRVCMRGNDKNVYYSQETRMARLHAVVVSGGL